MSYPENIFRRVVMHFAMRLDVVADFDDAGFFWRQLGAHLRLRPGEIVAVVVQRLVGVLAAEEAAIFLIGQNFIRPSNNSFGGFAEQRAPSYLIPMQIIFQ